MRALRTSKQRHSSSSFSPLHNPYSETGVGDHCYPLNSCPPQACQGQNGMLSAASLKEQTSKAKVIVKKEGLEA